MVFGGLALYNNRRSEEDNLLEGNRMEINTMWNEFPEIKEELKRCKKFMIESIDIPNKAVRKEVLKLINVDAKFIRPALMITIGKMYAGGGDLDDDFIKIAATLELLHMATLIHDDIVDDSPKRRGVESLQSKMGKDVAVYAGDYMLSSVFSNVIEHAKTMENIKKITRTVNTILSGELIQMEHRNSFSIEEDDYYKIIRGKTAVMIALSCYEGAYMSGNKEDAEVAWEFGEYVGMAFQLRDDILDVTAEARESKKPVNQDFKEGNFTLPVIEAMKEYSDDLKRIKKENIYSEEANKKVRDILEKSGAISYSQDISREYSEKAIKILNDFENGLFKKYLNQLVCKLLNRSN